MNACSGTSYHLPACGGTCGDLDDAPAPTLSEEGGEWQLEGQARCLDCGGDRAGGTRGCSCEDGGTWKRACPAPTLCMCDTVEEGWRPCPPSLCERPDHDHGLSEEGGERLARQFHEAYERLAPQFGYKTREASAVPWEEVPEPNKSLMIAVAGEVLQASRKSQCKVCGVSAPLAGERVPDDQDPWWLLARSSEEIRRLRWWIEAVVAAAESEPQSRLAATVIEGGRKALASPAPDGEKDGGNG